MSAMQHFTPAFFAFLRELHENNNRDWFAVNRSRFLADVERPMLAFINDFAPALRSISPAYIVDRRRIGGSMYRIYRDTRFSDDKTPLKTYVAAHFPSRRFGRSGGAGLYVEITPGWVWMGGGMYMPSGPDLQAIREHVADTYPRIHRIVTSPSFNKTVGPLGGDQLTRVPRGYLKDHPAADYLRYKQFLAGCEYPPQFATSARFYSELLSVFRTITPLVRFLNQPLEARLTPPPLLTDAAPPRDPRRAAGLDQRAAPMW